MRLMYSVWAAPWVCAIRCIRSMLWWMTQAREQGLALLASPQPARTIEDSTYWQWRVLAQTKGELMKYHMFMINERSSSGGTRGCVVPLPRSRGEVWGCGGWAALAGPDSSCIWNGQSSAVAKATQATSGAGKERRGCHWTLFVTRWVTKLKPSGQLTCHRDIIYK